MLTPMGKSPLPDTQRRIAWVGDFRKTKLSKSKISFSFFFFFFFSLNSISTYIQCATRRLSLCDIRKYRFPAFYGTSDRQAAIFFWTRMIQTWSSFSLINGPLLDIFLFFSKTKIFHSHPWDRSRDTASCRTASWTYYWLGYSGPCFYVKVVFVFSY